MVQTFGNATAGYSYSDATTVDLPRDTARIRPAHKPWCTRCKRKDRDLNTDQLCEPCARAAVSAAALRERWAETEKAEKEAARLRPVTPRRPKPKPRTRAERSYEQRLDLPIADIVEAYLAGATVQALAANYGCSQPTISRRLVAAGVTIRNGFQRHDLAPDRVAEVQRLYVEDQKSMLDVGKATGLSTAVVARVLRDAGIDPRPAVKGRAIAVVDVDEAAVVVDYNLGCTPPQLAAQYGCTAKRIRMILDRHGVTRRDDRSLHSGGANKFVPTLKVVAELRGLYEQGATIDELATRFDHGRRQITRVLRDAGVTIRPPVDQAGTELTPEQVAAAVADYASGMTLDEVGKKYRIRHQRVRDLVVAAGQPIRRNAATAGITALLRDHGLTALQVKQWGLETGRLDRLARGSVPRSLLDAYLEHHRQEAVA